MFSKVRLWDGAFINYYPRTVGLFHNPSESRQLQNGDASIVEGIMRQDLSLFLGTSKTPYSLQEVAVKIINNDICHRQYKFLFLKEDKKFIGQDMLCAGSEFGTDSCQVRGFGPGEGGDVQGSCLPFHRHSVTL